MKCLPRILKPISSSISNFSARLTISAHHSTVPANPHFQPESPKNENEIISTICNSLRKGLNWNTLTQKFTFLDLTNNSLIIHKVLLHLKHPQDAKMALSFFHWSAQHSQLKHDPYTYCITIHILVRAKLIKDARALLESVLAKTGSGIKVVDLMVDSYEVTNSTPFVFDLFVQSCSKLRMIDDAISVCQKLDEHGFKLSIISYNTLTHVVQRSDKTPLVRKIYEHMVDKRMYPNEVTMRIMVSALCKEGKLQKFVDIVERIHGKRCLAGVVVNTCLVFGMIEEGRIDEGLVILKWMLQKNMILDTISYALIVFARVRLGDLGFAWEVYEEMLKRGFNINSFVHTLFIGAHCEEGKIEEAKGLFLEMQNVGLKPYDETFNHLIVGCSKVGRIEESLSFCENMVDAGLVPSCLAFNEMVERLCAKGYAKWGDEMLTRLLDKGFVPNENTYSHLIAGYGKEGDLQGVLKLYYEMEYKSISPNSSVFVSLIGMLCHCRKMEEADKYLEVMKNGSVAPDAYIYEMLITGHLEKGNNTRAYQLYHEMLVTDLKPSSQIHSRVVVLK